MVLQSDWAAMSNGSGDQLYDGGKWDHGTGDTVNAEVVDAPEGHGFPCAKVLHAYSPNFTTDPRDGAFQVMQTLPTLDVGNTRTFRWYVSYVMPGTIGDPYNHAFQDGGSVSAKNWAVDFHGKAHGVHTPFDVETLWGMAYASHADSPWDAASLSVGGVYRELLRARAYEIQVQVALITSDTHRIHMLVTGSGGSPVYTDEHWTNSNGSGTLADDPIFPTENPSNINVPVWGIEGVGDNAPAPTDPLDMLYWGGVVMVDGLPEGTFAGAYGAYDGEVLP